MSYENQFQKKKKVPKHLPNYYDALFTWSKMARQLH